MKIAIDCDSAAIELKKVLVEHLKEKQVDLTDLDYLKDHDVDYPDVGFNLAREIAAEGQAATVDMIAKKGRAARLAERSRGVPDAGATSCCVILTTMAKTAESLLAKG
jgi:ribose 5-phosphate isomerase RpiB